MTAVWRNPLLAVGAVLLILGVGNWVVSQNKIEEYSERQSAVRFHEHARDRDDFPNLDERTSAMLLRRLHRGAMDTTVAQTKLEFYRVVRSGGRALTLAGIGLIGLALVQSGREARRRRANGDAVLRSAG